MNAVFARSGPLCRYSARLFPIQSRFNRIKLGSASIRCLSASGQHTDIKYNVDGKLLRRWASEINAQSVAFSSMWSLGTLGLVGAVSSGGLSYFGHGNWVGVAAGIASGGFLSALVIGASSLRGAGKLQKQLYAAGMDIAELRQHWWQQLTDELARASNGDSDSPTQVSSTYQLAARARNARIAEVCGDIAAFQAVEEFLSRSVDESKLVTRS